MKIVVGEGSCGIAAGAAKVYDKLASALDKSNELTITGCIGICSIEIRLPGTAAYSSNTSSISERLILFLSQLHGLMISSSKVS